MVKVKAKYFKKQYWPASILPNFTAMIYSRIKLQIKFRSDKNYSSIVVNFNLDLAKN